MNGCEALRILEQLRGEYIGQIPKELSDFEHEELKRCISDMIGVVVKQVRQVSEVYNSGFNLTLRDSYIAKLHEILSVAKRRREESGAGFERKAL